MGDNFAGFSNSFGTASSPTTYTSVMDVDASQDYYRRSTGDTNNGGYDVRDVVVPPLAPSANEIVVGQQLPGRGSGTSNGGERNECASDSKKFWAPWKKSKKMERIQVGPVAPCEMKDIQYGMQHPDRGKCLIFNHVNFDSQQGLSKRSGSEVDVEAIQRTFSNLGFQIVLFTDLTFEKIMEVLRRLALDDHSQSDCLAVFVLTHGQASELHAYDITYKPSSLWNQFTADKSSTLAGKPKLFFLNACRGDRYDDGTVLQGKISRTQVDGPSDEKSYRIPNQADFLTVYSTYEATKENVDMLTLTMQYLSLGFYSWRNNRNGSCFIQALCRVFNEYSQTKDVLSMLTLVNREVALNYESRSKDPSQNMKKQVPHVCHTLCRDVYLCPKLQGTLV